MISFIAFTSWKEEFRSARPDLDFGLKREKRTDRPTSQLRSNLAPVGCALCGSLIHRHSTSWNEHLQTNHHRKMVRKAQARPNWNEEFRSANREVDYCLSMDERMKPCSNIIAKGGSNINIPLLQLALLVLCKLLLAIQSFSDPSIRRPAPSLLKNK